MSDTQQHIETDPYRLKKCDNELCERRVTKGAGFCCAPCREAQEGGHEIGTRGVDHPLLCHTDGCQGRHEVRG